MPNPENAAAAPPAPSASPAPAAPAATASETVQRPPPGLARGVWEARPWLFYAIAAFVTIAGIAYALHRLGAVPAWRARAARRASRLR